MAATRDGGRIAAVRDTGLLDSDEPEDLDRLSRLAVELLGVPVSLVSLVEADRQFFAAQTGLPEPWASARETPLSHSFCRHVVERDAPLVVDDSSESPLVADNLAVRDLGVMAYAGIPVHDADGSALGAFCAIDTQPRKWSEHELEILADLAALVSSAIALHAARQGNRTRDALTGVLTRALVSELTDRAVAKAARSGGTTAVLAIGLDGFSLLNDALGHDAGDEVLRLVAERLTGALRPGDAVGRLARDQFVVLCEGVVDEADALRIAERLLRAIDGEPCVIDGADQPVSATAGLATTDTAVEAEELVTTALGAMRRAKAGSAQRVERVDAVRMAHASEQLRLRNAVARAHERGEMWLAYQPLVRLSTDRIVGFEALLRWDHPELGAVAPDVFIPPAEESGAIVAIGEWVLGQACADLAAWRQLAPAMGLHVAVNVAPEQLGVPIFADMVGETLDRAGLPASALELEITERTLLADRAVHRTSLERVRELGVRLSLDDFGTGYSALAYLTRFPLDELKIDRVFVGGLQGDRQRAGIVGGIVAMARALGLRTVAEGIETPEQLTALQRLGCDLGQGYLLSRPVPAAAVTELISPGSTLSRRAPCGPSNSTWGN